MEFICKDSSLSQKEVFKYVKNVKQKLTPEKLVGVKNSQSGPLLDFVKEIFKLTFEMAPDYKKLRLLLIDCLEKKGGILNN